jgi:hypothetical protein
MKTKVAIGIILMFAFWTYVGIDPESLIFHETYKAFDPVVDNSMKNAATTLNQNQDVSRTFSLIGFYWQILPYIYDIGGILILLAAIYTILNHVN